MSHHRLLRMLTVIAIAILPLPLCAQQSGAGAVAPKIRTVTAFIRMDRQTYRAQVADALKMLKAARIGIAVCFQEGCATDAAAAADILTTSAAAALELLLNEKRLLSTLRF